MKTPGKLVETEECKVKNKKKLKQNRSLLEKENIGTNLLMKVRDIRPVWFGSLRFGLPSNRFFA